MSPDENSERERVQDEFLVVPALPHKKDERQVVLKVLRQTITKMKHMAQIETYLDELDAISRRRKEI